MQHDSSASLAPDRGASLRRHNSQIYLQSRPTTSYLGHGPNQSRSQVFRPQRSSYHPPSTAHGQQWDESLSQPIGEPSVFAPEDAFLEGTTTQPFLPPPTARSHRRRSSIADSIRNGFTSVRTLGRRMSSSVRGRRPNDERPHMRDLGDMFEKEQSAIAPLQTDTASQTPGRHLLGNSHSIRRPSMPILRFTHTHEEERDSSKERETRKHSRAIVNRPECPPGGAGARASAAAQNEAYFLARSTPLPPYRPRSESFEEYRDTESGIGIAVDGMERSDSAIGHVSRLDPAEVLAPELVEHILGFLDAPTILEVGLVSKKWRDLCQSQSVWRHAFYREYAPTRSRRVRGAPKQAGLGKNVPGQDYRKLFAVRKQIDRRWNRGEAAAIYLDGHKDSVYCVQFDEDKIITGSRDNTIRIWDARTYQCIRKLGPPNNQRERNTIIRPDFEPSNVVPFFKMDAVSAEPRNRPPPIWHQASVLCLQYDSEILVTGSSDFTCIVWSIKDDYEPLLRLTGHRAGVLDVCIDATRIITCSKDTTIKIWNKFTGTLIKTLTGHRGPVNAVQVRGNLLASASGDTTAKLWRLDTGMCIKEFHSKQRGLACVEFSDDGRTMFAGGNDQVIFEFDTTTGNLRRELRGHSHLVRSLHLDSSNDRIISGSYDHSIKIWDAKSGIDAEDGGLKLSLNSWTSSWMLAAKSNYRKIACASQDGRVVIIDFGYGINGVELVEA